MSGARHIAWWTTASFMLAGCGAAVGNAGTAAGGASHAAATGASNTTPGPSPTAAFACTPASGGDAGTQAQLTGVDTEHHDGFDQVTFRFAPPVSGGSPHPLPACTVTTHPSSDFCDDARRQP